jgi:hypothetical protein
MDAIKMLERPALKKKGASSDIEFVFKPSEACFFR